MVMRWILIAFPGLLEGSGSVRREIPLFTNTKRMGKGTPVDKITE